MIFAVREYLINVASWLFSLQIVISVTIIENCQNRKVNAVCNKPQNLFDVKTVPFCPLISCNEDTSAYASKL